MNKEKTVNITITGNVKYSGEWHKHGDTLDVSESDYERLRENGSAVRTDSVTEEVKEKNFEELLRREREKSNRLEIKLADQEAAHKIALHEAREKALKERGITVVSHGR